MWSARASDSAPRTLPSRPSAAIGLLEVVVELDRGGGPERSGERAGARDAGQLLGARALDDGEAALGLGAVEAAPRLHHEAARAPAEAPHEALQPDEVGRLVLAVAHQPLHRPVALEVSGEALADARARQLRVALELFIG